MDDIEVGTVADTPMNGATARKLTETSAETAGAMRPGGAVHATRCALCTGAQHTTWALSDAVQHPQCALPARCVFTAMPPLHQRILTLAATTVALLALYPTAQVDMEEVQELSPIPSQSANSQQVTPRPRSMSGTPTPRSPGAYAHSSGFAHSPSNLGPGRKSAQRPGSIDSGDNNTISRGGAGAGYQRPASGSPPVSPVSEVRGGLAEDPLQPVRQDRYRVAACSSCSMKRVVRVLHVARLPYK